jgi:hypothetical protein
MPLACAENAATLSLQDRPVAQPGVFVRLKNFATDFKDPVLWQVVANTFVYIGIATDERQQQNRADKILHPKRFRSHARLLARADAVCRRGF